MVVVVVGPAGTGTGGGGAGTVVDGIGSSGGRSGGSCADAPD
ncbi:MAG: hypothetical protein ACRD1K_05890 [Acidimicrobiales bacterium]